MAYASVRSKLVAGSLTTVTPTAGMQGCAVLVPQTVPLGSSYGSYYSVLMYIGFNAGATPVQLPGVQGILLVDLPNGISTPLTEIAAAITSGGSGGPPSGVGGT
jgi:hypothetical protein